MIPAASHPESDLHLKVKSLARTNVELLRYIRVLREEHAALSFVMGVALDQSHEQYRDFERMKERYYGLLDQHRALVSGRTDGDRRQMMTVEQHATREGADGTPAQAA